MKDSLNGISTTTASTGCPGVFEYFSGYKLGLTATPKDYRYDAAAGSAEKAIEMATINGAKALNMENQIGSLEAGKKADISIFDMHRPDWVPLYNEIQNLVYSAQGGSCESVIIDGKFVMENRVVLTIDENEIVDRIQFRANKISKKLKLPLYSHWKWL